MEQLSWCQQWLSIARDACTPNSRQGVKIAFGKWGSRYFCDVCPVPHIWTNYSVICLISELSSARVENSVSQNTEPLPHCPTWQVELLLQSKKLIWVGRSHTIHVPLSYFRFDELSSIEIRLFVPGLSPLKTHRKGIILVKQKHN